MGGMFRDPSQGRGRRMLSGIHQFLGKDPSMDRPKQPEPADEQIPPEPAAAVAGPSAETEPQVTPSAEQEALTDTGLQWATYSGEGVTFHDPDATPAFGTPIPRPPKPADPFAVALGNASLLGVGYFLLGHTVLGVAAVLGTGLLLYLLLAVSPTLWFELVIVGWWVAVIAHGWWLARSRPRPEPVRTQRFVALGAALPVLMVFGLLRLDAAWIDQDAAAARADGDCGKALEATGKLWFGHRVVDAPLTERADDTVAACDRLRDAGRELDTALEGDTAALEDGFRRLRGVLADLPGHEAMVRSTLDRFLGALPTDEPCRTTTVTDWLREEKPGGVLDRANEVVPRVAPAAIVECADSYLGSSNWQGARRLYQQLLDQYPEHLLAPEAKEGVVKATQAIELANVRSLLTTSGGAQPAYCSTPAPYSAAKPYVPKKPNRALLYGNEHTGKIPAGWRAKDAADAVVVICAGGTEYGAAVATCPYEADTIAGYVDVTFHKIAIPVKVYELRTGKLVANLKLQINGSSCPAVLEYTTYSYVDLGPPSKVYVEASVANVRAAFRPLMVP